MKRTRLARTGIKMKRSPLAKAGSKQKEIMKQILDNAADYFPCMGLTRYYKGYGIRKTNFKNLPDTVWGWHLCNSPAQTMPEQYFFEKA